MSLDTSAATATDAAANDVVLILPRHRGAPSHATLTGAFRLPTAPTPYQPSPHPADVAQSRLFEQMLLAEIDDLEDRAARAERRRQRRSERQPAADQSLPEELKQLHQRIREVRCLLDALHQRFPPA